MAINEMRRGGRAVTPTSSDTSSALPGENQMHQRITCQNSTGAGQHDSGGRDQNAVAHVRDQCWDGFKNIAVMGEIKGGRPEAAVVGIRQRFDG